MFSNWSFKRTRTIALAVIITTLAMLSAGVSEREGLILPPGYHSPILALELATEPGTIQDMFATLTIQEKERLNIGTRLDYLFLLSYGLFLAGTALACFRATGSKLFIVAAALSMAALLGDALENLQLFKIFAAPNAADLPGTLHLLHLFTWLKWGSIAIAMALLAIYFFHQPWWGKIMAVLLLVPLLFTVVAFTGNALFAHLMFVGMMIGFLLLIVHSFARRDTTSG